MIKMNDMNMKTEQSAGTRGNITQDAGINVTVNPTENIQSEKSTHLSSVPTISPTEHVGASSHEIIEEARKVTGRNPVSCVTGRREQNREVNKVYVRVRRTHCMAKKEKRKTDKLHVRGKKSTCQTKNGRQICQRKKNKGENTRGERKKEQKNERK